MRTNSLFIAAPGVRSLCWEGDALVDWLDGGRRIALDGTVTRGPGEALPDYDGVVATADGEYAVAYQRVGTRAVLLHRGRPLRPLTRHKYHADAYDYPVALVRPPDGRVLLLHCPEAYNRLEIDDAATGERLTASVDRAPGDFFHSRLTPNPSGTRFFSAGWYWHPLDTVLFGDIAEALRDPRHLDRLAGSPNGCCACLAEESNACWLSDERVLLAASDEPEDPEWVAEEVGPGPRLLPNGLVEYDPTAERYERPTVLDRPAGTLMPVGDEQVVDFFEHPRLIARATGEVLRAWDELATGDRRSSIRYAGKPLPPLALDPARRRFAVADARGVTVVDLA